MFAAKGLMFGIDFARPQSSLKLKMAWDMLHKLNFGVFGQMIIIPLMDQHRILTQVAGYHTEVIKFLPPMIVTQAGHGLVPVRHGGCAGRRSANPGAAWDTVSGLAKRAMLA